MNVVLDHVYLSTTLAVALVAGGVSIALTCTSAGYPLRFAWCALMRSPRLRWIWKLVRCPHCNSWWSGLAAGLLSGLGLAGSVAQAFATLFLVFAFQHAALALGHDITPDEDFEKVFGIKEENNGP